MKNAIPCLQCGYSRVGLSPDACCPECGADGPSADALVVAGVSLPFTAWVPLLASGSFLGFIVLLQIVGMARGRWAPTDVPLLLTIALTAAVVVSLRMLRLQRERGADVVWLVRPTSVEIRAATSDTTLPLEQFDRCESTIWPTRRLAKLVLKPRHRWRTTALTLWMDRNSIDVERAATEITERILASRNR